MKVQSSQQPVHAVKQTYTAIVCLPAGFMLLVGCLSCAFSLVVQPAVAAQPTLDATAAAAETTIAAALSATPPPTVTPRPTATSSPTVIATPKQPATPDRMATKTALAQKIATDVAATQTAQAIGTSSQLATLSARQTAIAKTLTAFPTATLRATATRPPRPTATPVPSTVVLNMIAIPSGDFVMGSSDDDLQLTLQECNQTEGNCQIDWFAGEQPARTVFVDAFSISKYEVTNAQYNVCVANQVCPPIGRLPVDVDIPYKAGFFAASLPAVAVSWDNANLFCQWIGARLPSEAEWEKAARGVDGSRRYPWGATFSPGRANLSSAGPKAVGSYPSGASPYGVMDMAGNVFEWTATATDDGRDIVRGGGWSKFYFRGRVTDRGTKLVPNFVNYDIGFRCAR